MQKLANKIILKLKTKSVFVILMGKVFIKIMKKQFIGSEDLDKKVILKVNLIWVNAIKTVKVCKKIISMLLFGI